MSPPVDQGMLFNQLGGGFVVEPARTIAVDTEDAAGDEQPDYAAGAPTEPTPPYRGPWKDQGGMCSPTCPALRAVTGFSRPYSDCQVTGYRVEPGMWPCELRSIYEAVKRGPD